MSDLLSNLDTIMVRKRNCESYEGEELRRLQLVELGLLREFDRVCRKNGIQYSICAGTLLGAVRHKGFIPWDDDADIAMLREEYERFKTVADQLNPDICFFQDHDLEKEYLWGYGKIRKTGTIAMRAGQEHIPCRDGCYIDVFPLDYVPDSLLGQMFLDFKCFVYRKILWSKVAEKTESGVRRLFFSLLAKIPAEYVYNQIEKIRKRNRSHDRVRILLFPSFGKLYVKNPLNRRYSMPREWFLELAEYEFEDCLLYGTKDYDRMLKYMYDDYMTPPPPDKRLPKVSFSRLEY